MKEKFVNKPLRKKDALQLVTGQPVYTDDLAPSDCLTVKLLKSPYAHAVIEEINIDAAMKVPGVVCIITYKDVPQKRFTLAGQSYPEPSPYDRLILDKRVRFVGDPAAIIAAETEEAAIKAMRLIKVKYKVLEPVLDFTKAKDNKILVHPEDNWKSNVPVGADNRRNLCASGVCGEGDIDKVMGECDVVIERIYHTRANQQTMMETFRTYTKLDNYGRLLIVSSTQIPFHVRRIIGHALDIPKSRIRVVKPRIGGGFGAKQTAVSEMYPAIVTYKTGRPAKLIFTREEAMTMSSPRHEMQLKIKIGAMNDGTIRAVDLYTLSNTGAFGEHGPTTVGLSGHKSIPLYAPESFRFSYDVVYTNVQAAGAYRGYGATQGIFAIESTINELADMLDIDPFEIRLKNIPREGERMPAYYNEPCNSSALDRCLKRVREMSHWDEYYPKKDMGNGKVRSCGLAIAMQGSSISSVDVGGCTLKVNDDGFYTMTLGCSDMGTGCDTILAQMAADVLECDVDNIQTFGVDTDVSPYDSGSYASSTTYLTGMAVVKAAQKLRGIIIGEGAAELGIDASSADFDGIYVYESEKPENRISLSDIVTSVQSTGNISLSSTEAHQSEISPPPFMAGLCEIELDTETGEIKPLDYYACVDCGTVINPNLARVQTEGGIVQGIGMTLYEDVQYTDKGMCRANSFLQYKIPTRLDMGTIHVEFESSYEPTGPFGAKSIGEIVINTPAPAIIHAVANASGMRFYELPVKKDLILKTLGKIK